MVLAEALVVWYQAGRRKALVDVRGRGEGQEGSCSEHSN